MSILEVHHLTKRYGSGEKAVLAASDLSFSIEEGRCLGLVGESGCGKSTVASMVCGLLPPTSGDILFVGAPLYRKGRTGKQIRSATRAQIQMVFQNPADSFDPRYRVLQAVMEGGRASRPDPDPSGKPAEADALGSIRIRSGKDPDLTRKSPVRTGKRAQKKLQADKARRMLAYVGLPSSYEGKLVRELSGGECQRAALARALLSEPKLLICDEATSALDVSVQAQIIELLQAMKSDLQLSILFITHDLSLARVICDDIAVMQQGRIVEYGQADEVLLHPREEYTKLLVSDILSLHG